MMTEKTMPNRAPGRQVGYLHFDTGAIAGPFESSVDAQRAAVEAEHAERDEDAFAAEVARRLELLRRQREAQISVSLGEALAAAAAEHSRALAAAVDQIKAQAAQWSGDMQRLASLRASPDELAAAVEALVVPEAFALDSQAKAMLEDMPEQARISRESLAADLAAAKSTLELELAPILVKGKVSIFPWYLHSKVSAQHASALASGSEST